MIHQQFWGKVRLDGEATFKRNRVTPLFEKVPDNLKIAIAIYLMYAVFLCYPCSYPNGRALPTS